LYFNVFFLFSDGQYLSLITYSILIHKNSPLKVPLLSQEAQRCWIVVTGAEWELKCEEMFLPPPTDTNIHTQHLSISSLFSFSQWEERSWKIVVLIQLILIRRWDYSALNYGMKRPHTGPGVLSIWSLMRQFWSTDFYFRCIINNMSSNIHKWTGQEILNRKYYWSDVVLS